MNTPIWQNPIDLKKINTYYLKGLCSHLDIEFFDYGDTYLSAKMPITDKLMQPFGILHGGANCALAETVGSAAALHCVDTSAKVCVGLDIHVNHIRSVHEGLLIATATPCHLGKSTQVWNIEIKNQEKKITSVARLTMAVLDKKKGG